MFKRKLLGIYMSIYFITKISNPVSCMENGVNSLKEYLNNKFEIMKDRITLLEYDKYDREDIQHLHLNFHTVKELFLPFNCTSSSVFQIFNETFVLVDSQLYCMLPVSDKIILQFCKQLEHLNGKEILFAKATDFHGMGLLFVTLSIGYSYIYGYSKQEQQWVFLQAIKNKDFATDATFFVQNAHLYLVITNSNLKGAPLTIYKWTGIHFDEDSELFIGNCDGITSFTNNNHSEIIISTKIFSEKEFSTQVFEFKNGQLIKLQALNIPHPEHVIIYSLNSTIYVAIYNSGGNLHVLRWTGTYIR
ncbi:uncharacterized protein LOC108741906 [Agrilus planipennis]|uniref:Uncharacterized protein LOC108741906 n=1 Tax=Agrilus planipennis TaxID=224129 RepID=A0A7F5RB95_AGRPL|nr:uncharacterized protein LOC108741906 [Agrilus planipennis]